MEAKEISFWVKKGAAFVAILFCLFALVVGINLWKFDHGMVPEQNFSRSTPMVGDMVSLGLVNNIPIMGKMVSDDCYRIDSKSAIAGILNGGKTFYTGYNSLDCQDYTPFYSIYVVKDMLGR